MTDTLTVEKEEWRAIAGYKGQYEVSDHGRVRAIWFRNKQTDKPRIRILRTTLSSTGYATVSLRDRTHSVHRIVLRAFRGPCPQGHQAAHLDNNPANPCLENLRWVTPSENNSHKWRHGTQQIGERNPSAKLTMTDVEAILASRLTSVPLAAWYGVHPSTIQNIRSGRTWSKARAALKRWETGDDGT